MTVQPWNDKTVLVSGGSSGLGLSIACEVARQGASVAIIGRSLEKLRSAEDVIKAAGAKQSWIFQADARQIEESEHFLAWRENREIHLLINAIGRSDRGLILQLAQNEIQAMFEENVMTAWSCIRAVLSNLESSRGCVVNIGSLAGLIATPNLGGYCVSKFALTALSRQLRQELRDRGVHVLLVSPGPIKRDDSHQRYAKLLEERGLSGTAASLPGGGANLKQIDSQDLSQAILLAAYRRQMELVVPGKAKLLAAILAIWPYLGERILSSKLKK